MVKGVDIGTKGTVAPVSDPSSPAGRDRVHGAGDQYFAARPDVASRPGEVPLDLVDLSLRLRTDRGVFSAGRVDPGTKLLLMELPPAGSWPAGAVVDLGCGYGPIACTVARRAPGREVWAVDVNERARDLCRANAEAAGTTVRVAAPDEVPDDLAVGLLVSNPPIRVGKAVLHDLLTQWLARLVPDGEAWLVVQKHLGADSLVGWLADGGWTAERVRSRQGYRILRVSR
jgi:16S rRNA (guanine1207-N2)-methyltransferase